MRGLFLAQRTLEALTNFIVCTHQPVTKLKSAQTGCGSEATGCKSAEIKKHNEALLYLCKF